MFVVGINPVKVKLIY